jgi:hypothetical protein
MPVIGLKRRNERGQTALSTAVRSGRIANVGLGTEWFVPFRLAFFLLVCGVAGGQTPEDVVQFLRSAAQALASAHGGDLRAKNDAGPFLEHFDSGMPRYAELRDEVETLVERAEVGSAIEIVTDEGDDSKRKLELDWVLEVQDQRPRRAILKCTVEKKKKAWKITGLEPIEFFKY